MLSVACETSQQGSFSPIYVENCCILLDWLKSLSDSYSSTFSCWVWSWCFPLRNISWDLNFEDIVNDQIPLIKEPKCLQVSLGYPFTKDSNRKVKHVPLFSRLSAQSALPTTSRMPLFSGRYSRLTRNWHYSRSDGVGIAIWHRHLQQESLS